MQVEELQSPDDGSVDGMIETGKMRHDDVGLGETKSSEAFRN
jgi:hypothetical protein